MAERSHEFGCSHYRRGCQFVSPCCGRIYTCRFCHDEAETHSLERTKVKHVVCFSCKQAQKVGSSCTFCGILFGRYFCPICRLYDNEDKNQFHCDSCGICRVGGRSNFFHCPKCNTCLALRLRGAHTCIENSSRGNCPICLDDLHSSRVPSHVPPCGHLIHRTCYDELVKNSNYFCPVCSVSMINMSSAWEHLDRQVASTPMAAEYNGRRVEILCRDCHKESKVSFHVAGLKCIHCGSYNTCRTGDTTGRNSSASSFPSLPPRQRQLKALLLYLVGQLGRHREIRVQDTSSS